MGLPLRSANVITRITGSIRRSAIHSKDATFLKSFPEAMLADAIPYSSENATVDILIGSDYFWDIVELSDRISLPSYSTPYHRDLVTF